MMKIRPYRVMRTRDRHLHTRMRNPNDADWSAEPYMDGWMQIGMHRFLEGVQWQEVMSVSAAQVHFGTV